VEKVGWGGWFEAQGDEGELRVEGLGDPGITVIHSIHLYLFLYSCIYINLYVYLYIWLYYWQLLIKRVVAAKPPPP
jgi:hypothetical protein